MTTYFIPDGMTTWSQSQFIICSARGPPRLLQYLEHFFHIFSTTPVLCIIVWHEFNYECSLLEARMVPRRNRSYLTYILKLSSKVQSDWGCLLSGTLLVGGASRPASQSRLRVGRGARCLLLIYIPDFKSYLKKGIFFNVQVIYAF